MTVQIIATPPGSTSIVESGARIPVEPGVIYQIADVDDAGNVGPVLDPQSLEREPDGNDLQVTLPDGTVVVFEAMVPVLAQGAGGGLAGPGGELVIATLEQAFAPAAGPQNPTPGGDEGGSIQAFNQAQITAERLFGEAPEGPFPALGLPGFVLQPLDPNQILALSQEGPETLVPEGPGEDPDPQRDIVITADDGRIVVLGRALLANDSGTGLKIVSVQDYTGPGTVTLRPDGNVEISKVADNPNVKNSGLEQTFTYTVEDANGNQATTEVLVYVDEDGVLNGFINGPGSLGNSEDEIFVADHPGNENEPAGTMFFSGGDGDDFFQIRDEQNISIQGGRGFDTIVLDVEYASGFFDLDLPSLFSKTNNGIEAILALDDTSGNGVVRIRPHGTNSVEDWDFSRVELTNVDQIIGRGLGDSIIGSVGDDNIYADDGPGAQSFGADGNDFVDGWFGDDFIDLGNGTGSGVRDVVRISAIDHGLDTISGFDNQGANHDQLTLDTLFDKLELDLGGLSLADRVSRVSLVQDGADTNVFIDQSAAGDGSDLVQIADIANTNANQFSVGGAGAEDILVNA